MNLQRIDDALADWNRRLELMASNLLWLQAEPTYRLLSGSGGAARVALGGATAARVQPALAALPSVFQNFDLLHSTIDRATEARKGLSTIFGGDQKLSEIEHLLFGKSIKLPIEDVPLEQRTLLGQAQSGVCLSPDELLAPMAGIFAAARDAVLAVEGAWQDLATGVARAEAELEALRLQATGTGTSLPSVLDDAAQALTQLREQAQTDPLGALDELARKVRPGLDKASGVIATVLQGCRGMELARHQLEALTDLQREAASAAAEARAKIADCAALPASLDERRIHYLGEWLDRADKLLQDGLRDGALERFAAELANWKTSAEEYAVQAKKVVATNRAPVEARRELRGRLDALKAKARARGVAERHDVAAVAKKAETLIGTRPTNLAQAAEAVAEYAKTLNGGIAGS